MRKINGLTYLSLEEAHQEFLDESQHHTKEEIIELINDKQIQALNENGTTYINKLSLSYYITRIQQPQFYSRVECEGIIGINLRDLTLNGMVLDIGGGGEGIIGQIKSDHVIAIDPIKEELEEAPDGPIKCVMNAKNIGFLDHTFHTTTSFFTMMYIPKSYHKQVFEEIYRVLKPQGEFIMWDAIIPENDTELDILLYYLEIELQDKDIMTGYGIKWKDEQDKDYFIQLAKTVGFKVQQTENLGTKAFKLHLIKE